MSVLALVVWILLTPVVFIGAEVVFGSLVVAVVGALLWWLGAMLAGIAIDERAEERRSSERAARG